MFKLRRSLTVLATAALLGACSELTDLDVENPNAPDAARALASAEDVEALIGSSFYQWHLNQKDGSPSWSLSVASGENTSSWGNWGMQDWGTIPRSAYQNNSAYSYRGTNELPWYRLYGVISAVNDGLMALDGGMEFGQNGENTARGRAFAKFMQGMAYGYIAVLYDRAFLVDERVDLATLQFELVDYNVVLDAAVAMLDEAAQIASSNSFTIPDNWMPSQPQMTSDGLARLAKSYSARFIASNARNPAERAAVNWNDVLTRANAGITGDFALNYDGDTWWEYIKNYSNEPTWMRASYYTIGEADQSGAYENWLNTPVQERQPFNIVTDDRRITGADGPTSPGTDFMHRGPSAFAAARGTYFFSNYGHSRFLYLWPSFAGVVPMMRASEMDHLKAEAYLRLGQKEQAVPLINSTRVTRGQLPPAQATESVEALMAKMQYEKRIEQWSVAFGGHYFDARGWGRLITGTPIHMPIPARELETLGMPLYTFGGGGGGGGE
jgi:hypothetical protein